MKFLKPFSDTFITYHDMPLGFASTNSMGQPTPSLGGAIGLPKLLHCKCLIQWLSPGVPSVTLAYVAKAWINYTTPSDLADKQMINTTKLA